MKIQTNKAKSLDTIIVLALALIIVYLIRDTYSLLYISVALLAIGIISKKITQFIHVLWMKLSEALAFVSSKIILAIIFYFFLTPISLFYRLFKRNSLFTKSQSSTSNFIERFYQYSEKDIENPW